jgi:23S rRNA (uridine2552-2'-O)-methyltransferase
VASKNSSSKAWLKEHFDDSYVQRAQRDGYRSRACYKLLEIHEKDRLFKPGMTVVDLGAAPGGWSQVAVKLVGESGRVIASDILPMGFLAGVDFIQGDFAEEEVLDRILQSINGVPVDLVISDMAPNMSGMAAVDQPRSMHLVELAAEMAKQVLKPKGTFLTKVFQGEGFETLVADTRQCFDAVLTRKPNASRARSREVFLLAKGYKA